MGRLAVNVAGLPKNRRGAPFRDEENTRLVQEVEQRIEIIYGTKDRSPQPRKVRLAWKEIAEIISSLSGVQRSADQCRKRYNDIKRKRNMADGRKRGRPSKHSAKGDVCAILKANKLVEPEDLEFEVQAPMDDDPDYEPTPKKREAPKIVVPKEIPMPTKPDPPAAPSHNATPSPSLPKSRSVVVVRKPAGGSVAVKQPADETHPFLELQQAGFDMLKRELSGFRDSVMSLNTRLNHLEIALRPIGHIAESLARVANAVERLTCPPE